MPLFATIATLTDADDRAFMLDLYQKYYGLVRSNICRVTRGNDCLEDLVNDTFIRLIERISIIRALDCCRLNTYVVLTSKRVAINYLRRREVQNQHISWVDDIEAAAGSMSVDDTLEERIISGDEYVSLKVALQQLPEQLRDVLFFKYYLEMDDREIAQELLISPDSVRQYLTRARRSARQLMQKEVGSSGE